MLENQTNTYPSTATIIIQVSWSKLFPPSAKTKRTPNGTDSQKGAGHSPNKFMNG